MHLYIKGKYQFNKKHLFGSFNNLLNLIFIIWVTRSKYGIEHADLQILGMDKITADQA